PDLFWALRGGGGNFGVVTSFVFGCHPLTNVIAGPTLWPVEATAEVLSWYRDFLPAQNEDLYGFFATLTVPPGDPFPAELHNRKACGVVWCYTGDPADADAAFAPVREQAPQWEGIGSVPYPGLQSAFDPLYPKGLQWYWRGDVVRTIPDEAVAVHARFAEQLPSPLSTMHLYPIDGAVQRVGAADTAWSHRDVTWSGVIAGIDPDPRTAEAISRWTVDYWEAQHPYSAGGAYVNFMMDEGPDRVRATYGANYDRLCAVKGIYDPENVLRINQNLPPRG
ncbi:MAG: FAD-binding oxidoreductase, partial [Pseudonocardia sp.]